MTVMAGCTGGAAERGPSRASGRYAVPMRRTVLLVEDETSIAELVEMYLEQAGFRTRWVTEGRGAADLASDPTVDVVLLDLMLPDVDGVELFREIRARRNVPVIMVTARDSEGDRVLGLELGADDYVTKPFSPRELVARVRTVLRRAEREDETTGGAMQLGEVRLDPVSREVTVADERIELTRTEFDLLAHLSEHPGRVFTRAQLLADVWGYPEDVDTRTVDVHVAQLRRKLGGACPVKTVRGVGYKAEA